MTIKSYYEKWQTIYYSESIVALALAAGWLGYGLFFGMFWFIGMTILLLMLFSTMRFIKWNQEKYRITQIEMPTLEGVTLATTSRQVVGFLPAPTLKLVLFHPTGQVVGEISDKRNHFLNWLIPSFLLNVFPREYEMCNERNSIVARFVKGWGADANIAIFDDKGAEIGISRFGEEGIVQKKGYYTSLSSLLQCQASFEEGLTFCAIEKTKKKPFVRYTTGLMPLKWSTTFQNANMPMLSFTETALPEERLFAYSFCIAVFRNYNH